MLLWEYLLVMHRLDGGVVVVLVDFLVQSSLDSVLLLSSHGLLRDGGCDILVDGGIMVSGHGSVMTRQLMLLLYIPVLGGKLLYGVFSGLHFDCCLFV